MSSLLRRKNLKDCCRTCLNDLSAKMHGLFEEKNECPSVAEILSMFTNIMAQSEDMLPQNLCNSCYNCLTNFYDFKKHAEKIDLQLHEYYDSLIATVKPEDSVGIQSEFTGTDHDFDEFNLIEIKHENTDIKVEDDSQDGEESSFSNKLEPTNYNLQVMKSKKTPVKALEIYECPDCLKTFVVCGKYEKHLLTHRREQNTTESVVCDICSATFRSTFSLAAHKRKHVPKGRVLSCQICNKIFKKMSHLKRHEASHGVNRNHKCPLCPKAYHLESQLTEHMFKHNGKKAHPCPICPKEFAHLSTLNNHLKIHTRGKPFLCQTCGKSFDSSTNMKQHVKRHLGLKTFSCELCPGRFVSKGGLFRLGASRTHRSSEMGRRRMQVRLNFGPDRISPYSSIGELNSHINTHTGEKSYQCEHCPATFTAPHSLKKHNLKHLGIKPFHCDKCPMKFTTRDYLSKHYRTHTGEKPYQCDLCERAFTQSGDLLKHKRGHLGVNLYKCDQCTLSFRLKTQLRQHISDHYVSMKARESKDATATKDTRGKVENVVES